MIKVKRSSIIIIILSIILFIIFSAILIVSNNSNIDACVECKYTTVAANTFSLEATDSILIDVRTPEEYNAGKISGAINIDYNQNNFRNELNKLDKEEKYTIYCRSGNRSSETIKIMKELGFTNVIELGGGTNSWSTSGYSLE